MLTWVIYCLYSNMVKAIADGGKLAFPEYLFFVSMVFDVLIISAICYAVCYVFKNEGDDIL